MFIVSSPTLLRLGSIALQESLSLSSSKLNKQVISKPVVHPQQAVEQDLKFEPEVVLPPDSFLVLRLPFIYHTVETNGKRRPLSYNKDAPERSAWLVKGTALRLLARGAGAMEALALH